MRILMTGGGTAGHINPALAIAEKIRQENPDAEILFVGAKGRMETRLVPAAGFPIETVDVRGFQRRLTVKNMGRNLSAAVHAVTSGGEALRILKRFRPDMAIGTGGYVSGPVLRRAAKMGIPILVHESNAFPGVTVKLLAKHAEAVLIADEAARRFLPPDCRVIVTGNPLGSGFADPDRERARRELQLDSRPMILSYGGSLGAERINAVMTEVLERSQQAGELQHIHGAGRGGYEKMCAHLKERGISPGTESIRVREYIDDMPRCMAAADLVICRCGAMTLSELPAAGKPAILIPSPNVAENHQYHNAMALVKKGAALCMEEKDLTADALWETLSRLMADPAQLHRMGENARDSAITDAADRIYMVVKETLEKHGTH
ncbi:MAG: undecaprenyldiphospho-muramoylpentapeptide beta-N-acetylglucosaminyltransferase [Clostridiales bacterium]|nr:undecaprenyldiphospho-muramoylpentapeptide beta-N-acetylglucosaminyltransferase [Clostridiales bacterium]